MKLKIKFTVGFKFIFHSFLHTEHLEKMYLSANPLKALRAKMNLILEKKLAEGFKTRLSLNDSLKLS